MHFLHRFLQHVLPKGFVKIRYYGFFAPGARPHLAALQQQLNRRSAETQAAAVPSDGRVASDSVRCPVCSRPMVVQSLLRPSARCPP